MSTSKHTSLKEFYGGTAKYRRQQLTLLKPTSVHLTQLCLRSAILYKSTDTNFYPPAAYTGELFRIEYLYSEIESNLTLGSDIDTEIEEGLNDEDHLVTFAEEEGSLDSELDVAVHSS
jgi:hypothetical protein